MTFLLRGAVSSPIDRFCRIMPAANEGACYCFFKPTFRKPIMIKSFFFIFKRTLAWLLAYSAVATLLHETLLPRQSGGEEFIVLLGALLGASVIVTAFSHV
ncbi:MAG: hypothetical protein H7335_09285, partial [Massilia sp.]|nr:hypothetical protein [Massilia sp.]